MSDIYIDHKFLSEKTISLICNYVTSTDDWIKTDDHWSEKFIHQINVSNQDIKTVLDEIRIKIENLIYSRTNNKVFTETLQLVRWRKGDKLDPPHADCEHLDGSPHPYPNRHYSVLIYLNKDYDGGQIFFPNQNLEPTITPGTLVQFEGTKEYLHGVKEVTSGERYTIVLFLTKQND